MNMSSHEHVKVLVNMPFDFEINGRFYYQAREILGPNFDIFLNEPSQRQRFMDVMLDTMVKCDAIQYHKDQFSGVRQAFIAHIELGGDITETGHELLFELEAFLFQMKSALDIGVKLLGVLIPQRFPTFTFSGKGDKLIRALEQFGHDKTAKSELVTGMVKMLQDDREAWLEQAITLRDTISHFKTFAEFRYRKVDVDGKPMCVSPQVAGRPAQEYIDLTYKNCLEFLQDFMCLSIGLFLPPNFSVGIRPTGTCGVGEPLAQYVKFVLSTATKS